MQFLVTITGNGVMIHETSTQFIAEYYQKRHIEGDRDAKIRGYKGNFSSLTNALDEIEVLHTEAKRQWARRREEDEPQSVNPLDDF